MSVTSATHTVISVAIYGRWRAWYHGRGVVTGIVFMQLTSSRPLPVHACVGMAMRCWNDFSCSPYDEAARCHCPDTATVGSGSRTSSLDVQLLKCPENEAVDHVSWTVFGSLDDWQPRPAIKRQSALEQTNWQTDRLTDWQTDRLTDWQTDRLTDWQTDRLTDWQTGLNGRCSRATT